jgi:L-asparagine transporter-like permease
MIAIGGAIGTGLFLGSGFAIGLAGPAVLVSYVIGGTIALLLMGCLAEMTIAHPSSGAFGDLAEIYLGSLAGFLVRYAYWSPLVLAVGTELTAVATYMRFWLPTVPGWIWMLGFGAALVAANAVSVSVFGAIEYVFSAIKIVAILAFIALGATVIAMAPAGSTIGLPITFVTAGFCPTASAACGPRLWYRSSAISA